MSILLELNKNSELLKKLSRPLDEAVYTIAVLRKLGNADISTLNKRIICQKIIYLSNRLQLSPIYNFNLYVHGPYSPDLATDLYSLSSLFDKIQPADFICNKTQNRFDKLVKLLTATGLNSKKLEILTTLDLFRIIGANINEARNKTKEIKGASEEDLDSTEKLLKECGIW